MIDRYVASSGRPIHEILAPNTFLREDLYDEEFAGMTREKIPLEVLVETGSHGTPTALRFYPQTKSALRTYTLLAAIR